MIAAARIAIATPIPEPPRAYVAPLAELAEELITRSAAAALARKCLAKFDHASDLARERGIHLGADFYDACGRAHVSVRLEERAVNIVREKLGRLP